MIKKVRHFKVATSRRGRFVIMSYALADNKYLLSQLLPDPDLPFAQGDIVFSGRLGNVTDTVKIVVNDQLYLLKRYNFRGLGYALKNAFRSARCFRTFLGGHYLAACGVPTPLPVLAIAERRFRLLYRSYVLFPYITQSVHLLELWPGLDQKQRKEIMRELGQVIGRMHRCGFHHGDLNWRNILVKKKDEKYSFQIVDLDGYFIKSPSQKSIKHDLRHFLRDFKRTNTAGDLFNVFIESWEKEM